MMGGGNALLCFLVVLDTEPGTSNKIGSHSSTELAQKLTQRGGGQEMYANKIDNIHSYKQKDEIQE